MYIVLLFLQPVEELIMSSSTSGDVILHHSVSLLIAASVSTLVFNWIIKHINFINTL